MNAIAIVTYETTDHLTIDSSFEDVWTVIDNVPNVSTVEDCDSVSYNGQVTEDPSHSQIFCDRKKFEKTIKKLRMDTNRHTPLIKSIPATGSVLEVLWAQFVKPVNQTLESACTEVCTMYVALGTDQAEWYREVWSPFSAVLLDYAEGLVDVVGGWIYGHLSKDGERHLGFAAIMGWTSFDAHMKFRDSKAYKDHVGKLSDGCVAIDMHHVTFYRYD